MIQVGSARLLALFWVRGSFFNLSLLRRRSSQQRRCHYGADARFWRGAGKHHRYCCQVYCGIGIKGPNDGDELEYTKAGSPESVDTLGAALWGVDVIFTLAEAGWLGINFHGGSGNYYFPIAQTSSGTFEPRPLYYAMLLFAYAGRGSLVPIHWQRIRPTFCEPSPAVRGTDEERRVLLTKISRKMRVYALPHPGRKQRSCA